MGVVIGICAKCLRGRSLLNATDMPMPPLLTSTIGIIHDKNSRRELAIQHEAYAAQCFTVRVNA